MAMSMGTTAALGAAGIASVAGGTIFGLRWLIRHGQFSFHNSRLTTIGNPLLAKDELQPLIEAPTPEALSKLVQGDLTVQPSSTTLREMDRDLTSSFHAFLENLTRETPKAARPVLVPFIRRYESEELKRLIRRVGKGNEPLNPVGLLTEELERHLLASKDLANFLEVLEVHPSYSYVSPELKGGDIDLPAVDSALDKFSLDAFSSPIGLSGSGRKGVSELHRVLCDRYNLNIILRSLATGLDRERTLEKLLPDTGFLGRPLLETMAEASTRKEAVSLLSGSYIEPFFKDLTDPRKGPDIEMALDRMLLSSSGSLAQRYWSTVGPTIRFLIARELELKNLRTLYVSKFGLWREERTRSMLIMEDLP
ncbi:MAG: V-type ATPase subunit [Candidatus Thermoplasmatota archaeon]|nr:V-type ATPase subunit [Candidatus Thermoplasmatota archaeon]